MNIPAKISAQKPPYIRTERPRLLIVDDSVVVRSAISHIMSSRGDVIVAEKLPHMAAATSYLRENRVDVILLDHEMPGQNGVDGLPEILALAKGARVAIMSGHCARGSEAAVRALALGASDVIQKPRLAEFNDGFADMLAKKLWQLAIPEATPQNVEHDVILRAIPPEFRLDCLGIGASTGGIYALGQLLGQAHAGLGVPVLVTQHLPETFTRYFAEQLARMTSLPVSVAETGKELRPDHIYVAPGNANFLCERKARGRVVVKLSDEKASPLDPLPAVNLMFSAMADAYGAGAAGIILTGMGRDGTAGARKIAAAGGLIVAQDKDSSVVWGMPGYAARAGLASALLAPADMLPYLRSHARVPA